MSKVITIEVIDVGNEQHVPTDKGGYNKIEIAYKDNGKVGGKKLVDFANKELYSLVKSLKRGDQANVTLEKEEGSDGREYWQWKDVVKFEGRIEDSGTGTTPDRPQQPTVSTTQAKTGKVIGSNYETPEERARRQVLIVRQSSITAALGFLTLNGGTASQSEVLDIASKFEDYVFNGLNLEKQASDAAQNIRARQADDAPKKRGRPSTKKTVDTAVEDEDIPF